MQMQLVLKLESERFFVSREVMVDLVVDVVVVINNKELHEGVC